MEADILKKVKHLGRNIGRVVKIKSGKYVLEGVNGNQIFLKDFPPVSISEQIEIAETTSYFDDAIQLIERYSKMSYPEFLMLCGSRKRDYVEIRQIHLAFLILCEKYTWGQATALYNQDHSMIYNAFKVVSSRYETDKEYRSKFSDFFDMIESIRPDWFNAISRF